MLFSGRDRVNLGLDLVPDWLVVMHTIYTTSRCHSHSSLLWDMLHSHTLSNLLIVDDFGKFSTSNSTGKDDFSKTDSLKLIRQFEWNQWCHSCKFFTCYTMSTKCRMRNWRHRYCAIEGFILQTSNNQNPTIPLLSLRLIKRKNKPQQHSIIEITDALTPMTNSASAKTFYRYTTDTLNILHWQISINNNK